MLSIYCSAMNLINYLIASYTSVVLVIQYIHLVFATPTCSVAGGGEDLGSLTTKLRRPKSRLLNSVIPANFTLLFRVLQVPVTNKKRPAKTDSNGLSL